MSVSHAPGIGTGRDAGLDVISALLQVFGGLIDPRSPRGIRHELASVLTITVLAVLAGARNFREAGDRAAEIPADLLIAAGARINAATGLAQPPNSATISRITADIDAAHADARVGAWLAECVTARRERHQQQPELPEGVDWLDGLAIDGKVVRNSAGPRGINVKLFSALLHREQVVIAQIAVPEHTTEVTCVPALLDPDDLTLPQPHQGITESAGQPGHVSNIGQQTSTGMTDHAPTTTRDRNLRTRTGTLHLESAFREGRMRP